MLNKKKQMKDAVAKYNIPTNKYSHLISNFINSYDFAFKTSTLKPFPFKLNLKNYKKYSDYLMSQFDEKNLSNDLDMLVDYIVGKETRINELVDGLKSRGLVLRVDSVLCSKYIDGNSEYTLDYILDTMEQMDWFFTNTKYSQYCREYDDYEYKHRTQEDYYYSMRDRYDLYNSDDSDYEKQEQKEKENYNKIKSEYVKNKCLTEWISNGKKGIYPKSLIPQIEQIEKKLEYKN